jgi:hypothetical protein
VTEAYVSEDPAARVAGLIARIDHEVGFWKSPSNEELFNVGGLDRPIDFALGDPNSRANLLNANRRDGDPRRRLPPLGQPHDLEPIRPSRSFP